MCQIGIRPVRDTNDKILSVKDKVKSQYMHLKILNFGKENNNMHLKITLFVQLKW